MTMHRFLTLCLFLFLASSCGGSLTGEDEGVTSKPNVGTNMGNPKTSPSSLVSLVFKTEPSASSSHEGLYCTPIQGVNDTQRCYLSTSQMTLGVMALYYVDCLNGAGESIGCLSPEVTDVGERFLAFDSATAIGADQDFDLEVTTAETGFSQPLNPLEKEMNVGGIQIVMSHLNYRIPENEDILASLHGLPILHCLSSDTISAEQKSAFCGNATSLRGDITFDDDGDGIYEYLNYAATELEFFDARPADYAAFTGANPIANGTLHYLAVDGFEFTDGVDYPVPGYFAPVLGFKETQSWSPDTQESVHISFDLRNTLAFIDGARFGIKDGVKRPVCVSQLASQACAYDADPLTVGKYDYHVDGALHTIFPKIRALIQ